MSRKAAFYRNLHRAPAGVLAAVEDLLAGQAADPHPCDPERVRWWQWCDKPLSCRVRLIE